MDTIFFIASKILGAVFSPLIWIFVILIWSLLAKNPKKKKGLLIISICMFYIFTNSFIVDEVMRWWEVPAVNIEQSEKKYDFVIVLGGMMSYYDSKNNQIGINKSIDRFMQGLKLLNKGYAKKMIFSGGDGSLMKTIGKEAEIMKNYLNDININTENIIFESQSQNTYENAKYTSELLKNHSAKNVIVVTSAFHVKRAINCFEKQGIKADYYPAERYAGKRKYQLDHLLLPNVTALDLWDKLFHEWIGYIAYKIMGYA